MDIDNLLDEAKGTEKYYDLLKDETPTDKRLLSFKKLVCRIFKYRHDIMAGCKNIAKKTEILDKSLNRFYYFVDDDRVSHGMFKGLGKDKQNLLKRGG